MLAEFLKTDTARGVTLQSKCMLRGASVDIQQNVHVYSYSQDRDVLLMFHFIFRCQSLLTK